ncbi:uncharacterized protein LOC143923729 isoform X3 [Lithobates pipiens]
MLLVRFLLLLLCLQQTGHALQLTAPSSHRAMMGEDVNISCSFTISNPPINKPFLAITWYFQAKKILSVQNTKVIATDPRMSYTGRAEDGIADLSISNITIMDGGIYKCSILYTPKREEKEIRLDIQAPPQISITEKLVVKNRENVLRSVISGFYPVDIDIKWLRDGKILDNVIMEKPLRDLDGTYSVRSSVTITPTKEDRERIFSCRVQHESLTAPLQEDFQLVYGAIPSIHITSQAFILDVEQTLVCSVSGFYPESIVVNWFLNDTLVKNIKTRRISSSAVESDYDFIPTQENRDMELRCVVEHATLTTPHVERLRVQVTDLTAKYKKLVPIVAVVLISILGTVTFYVLCMKKKKKSLPKVRDIARSPGGIFTLDVHHFYPEAITISWEVIQPPSSTEPRPIDSTILMHQNQDGTFNATSSSESLRGVIREDEPYIVRASVQHKKLKYPSQREWKSDDKDNRDFLSRPEVEMKTISKLFVNKQTQLVCTISNFYPDNLTVEWFKKEKGKQELVHIVNSEKYKITNSKSQHPDKTFTCTELLEVTPSPEDQGSEVICKVSHPSLEEPIEKTTGPLHVLAKPEIQQSIQLPINASGDIMASFRLSSFYPKDINVTWMYGPTQEQKQSTEAISDNPDGTFTVTSQCTIPGNLCENPQFRVRVAWNHPSMGSPEYREISLQDPDFPWRPKIKGITPFILQLHQEVTVRCTISGYFSNNLTVTWIEKKGNAVTDCTQNRHNYTISDIRHERMADNSYQCSPSLSFTPISDKEDLEFICRVEHPSLEHPIERSTGPPRVNVAPQETDIKVTPSESDRVLCSLILRMFYPQNIDIKWSNVKLNIPILPSTKKIIQTNDEKLFDAVSECVIPWKSLESSVRVTWTHDSLKEPGHRDLRITDLPCHPHIEELNLSDLKLNTESKIQVKISGYFPEDLTVEWYKQKMGTGGLVAVDNNKYESEISGHQRQSDNTYSCTASLLFTPTLPEDQRSEFMCRVQHPSLEQPIQRRIGPLQITVAPQMIEPVRFSPSYSGEVRCSLTLKRFYPPDIKIRWSAGESQTKLMDDSQPARSADGETFDVTSVCTLPRTLCFPVYVTWEHQSVKEPQSIILNPSDLPWHPHIEELNLSDLKLNTESKIQVKISGYFPEDLTVEWNMKKTGTGGLVAVDINKYKSEIGGHQRQSDNTYSCTASLLFTPTLPEDQRSEFICKVQHPSLEQPIERRIGPLQITVAPQMIEPVRFSLSDSGEVRCSLTLKRFYPPDIKIRWSAGESQAKLMDHSQPAQSADGETFDVTSVCTLPRSLCFPVYVTWEHQSVTEPQSIILNPSDLPWHPHIEELNLSDLKLNTESKIQVKISGYFPEDLTVEWNKKEMGTDRFVAVDNKYKTEITGHQRQSDNTNSCTASLLFTPTLPEDQRSEFICRVQHPSLEQDIQRRIGPLQITVAPQMIEPVRFSLSDSGEVRCSLTLKRFYPPDIKIRWSAGESQTKLMDHSQPAQSADGETFDVTSVCTLPRSLCFPVYVTWEHQSVKEPPSIILNLSDLPWHPHIEELNLSDLKLNTESKIQVKISGYFPEDLTVEWYKKKMRTDGFVAVDINKYKTEITGHQRQSDNTNSCTASLLFTPTLPEDQGSEFICIVKHPILKQPIQRRIGPIQIMVAPQMIEPVRFSLSDSGEVRCSLTLKRFYPPDIKIRWSAEESQTKPMDHSQPAQSADGETFDVTSVCTLPRSLCFPVYVTWEHQSVKEPQSIILNSSDLPWHPQIEELNSPDLKLNTESKIQAKISGYFPEDLTVEWYKKMGTDRFVAVDINKYKSEISGHQRQSDNTYSCTASLLFTPTLPEDQRSEFICRVQHPSLEQPIERRIGPLQITVAPQEIEPVRFSLSKSGEVRCTLTLKRFYPSDITITWHTEQQTKLKSDGKPAQSADGETFDVTSVCTLPRSLSFPVYVTWEHQSVREPQRTVLRRSDLPWHPQISELNSSDLKLNTESKIQVNISGYFPEDLTVEWNKKEMRTDRLVAVDNNKYKSEISEHQRQSDNTYSCTASLLFTPTLPEDQGSEFICTVQHPSLEQPIERRIGPLQITDLPWRPQISELNSSDLKLNTESKIQVNISGYFPEDLTVEWNKKEMKTDKFVAVDINKYKSEISEHQRQSDNTYSCTASLLFTPTLPEDQRSEFMCRVQHPSLEQPIQRRIGPLQITVAPQEIEPVTFSLSKSGEVTCTLTLKRFYPSDITITWSTEQQTKLKSDGKPAQSADGETFDVTSVCTLPRSLCFPVYVTWEHQSVRQPQRIVLKRSDLPWLPQIGDINLSNIKHKTKSTLQVKISGYFPEGPTVEWSKKKMGTDGFVAVDINKYKSEISEHQRQSDNTYSCTASLLFTPTLPEDQGSEFMCRVRHPSLEQPIERRIGPLHITEPEMMNQQETSDREEVNCQDGGTGM